MLAHEKSTVFTQCGFDLSDLNGLFSQPYHSVNQTLHSPTPLSARFLFRKYNYKDDSCLRPVRRIVVASNSGTCHGVTTYFQAWFGDFVVSSEQPTSHWAMAFHPLPSPISIESGKRYIIDISGDGRIAVALDNTSIRPMPFSF